VKSIERQYQDEIDELSEERDLLYSLLWHAVYRNHKFEPAGCSYCEELEKKLREIENQ
jgi:hypothetical protein